MHAQPATLRSTQWHLASVGLPKWMWAQVSLYPTRIQRGTGLYEGIHRKYIMHWQFLPLTLTGSDCGSSF
jgi:hypothetical protein